MIVECIPAFECTNLEMTVASTRIHSGYRARYSGTIYWGDWGGFARTYKGALYLEVLWLRGSRRFSEEVKIIP